jgi:hypothetical protein
MPVSVFATYLQRLAWTDSPMAETDIPCRVAESVFLSPRIVEKYLYKIYQKAGIKNRLRLFNLLRSDAL